VLEATLKKYPSLIGVCGDAGYRGTFVEEASNLGLKVDISERIKPEWAILPKRWRVERTLGWMNNSRRLSKDFEITTVSAEAMCYISHSATLLKRF